jgi:hypothetical protein
MNRILGNSKSFLIVIPFVFIFLLYLFFPTNNSSLDAFAYAGDVKYSQNLFTPHHLLYNPLIWLLYNSLEYLKINVEVLFLGKLVNAFFQLFNLIIFYKILSIYKIDNIKVILYVLILGFSFGLWRYGTENEMYIVPISFSLLSSYFYLKSIINLKNKYIFFSGLFGAVACLFHQIHFFWWLGILIGVFLQFRKIKEVIIYILPAIIVPLVYALVLVFYEHRELNFTNFIHFVFYDFYNGNVTNNFSLKVIFFQIINSVRVFFQIHPSIYLILKNKYIFIIPFIISVFLSFVIVKQIVRSKLVKMNNGLVVFSKIHLGIFFANYLFAFYSFGNVEFMILLPFLLLIIIANSYSISNTLLVKIAGLFFVWNFFFGILPNNILSLQNERSFVDYIEKNSQNIFIVSNGKIKSQYFYRTGVDDYKNIIVFDKINKVLLDSILKENDFIYTDFINKPVVFDRARFVNNKSIHYFNKIIETNKIEPVFEYRDFYGNSIINKISKRK